MCSNLIKFLKLHNSATILTSYCISEMFVNNVRISNLLNKNANAKTTRNEIESSKDLNHLFKMFECSFLLFFIHFRFSHNTFIVEILNFINTSFFWCFRFVFTLTTHLSRSHSLNLVFLIFLTSSSSSLWSKIKF